ncbi:hypothetical protein YW7DRAFT_07105 [Streptomyces sp. AmelKG-E11A]|nr:hypothetical protein YW7DRAFT_07105 [Streptomyces sp. AmelKG-E11A]
MPSGPQSVTVPGPEHVRYLRAQGERITDVWDAADCGLTAGRGCAERLTQMEAALHPAPDGTSRIRCADELSMYMVQEPVYEPYRSAEVPRYEAGDRAARQVLSAAFAPEVIQSVMESPLLATAQVTAAQIQAGLWTAQKDSLAALMEAVPRKGGEVPRILDEYCVRHAESRLHAAPMALRDFILLWFAAAFIRVDGRMLDLCGSTSCLMMAVDYVSARDDAGGGGHAAYAAAASEGLACLAGESVTQALRDTVLVDAVIRARDITTTATSRITDLNGFVDAAGGPVTPQEYMRARWWDAAMVPYHRLPMSAPGYRHTTDELGTFTVADRCGAIKRALDCAIRYNEIVDIVPDCANGESFNEVLLALASGGGHAVYGYGDALARVTDDVLRCDCGASGHEEAAELAMGDCLFYLLTTRYQMRRQLQCLSAAGGEIQRAYAQRPPGARLKAVASTTLQPGNLLHSDAWEPLWKRAEAAHCMPGRWADHLARRAARRSLPGDTAACDRDRCETIITSLLVDCDNAPNQSLPTFAKRWGDVFDAVLTTAAADHAPSRQHLCTLRELIERIWLHCVVDGDDDTPHPAERADEQLAMDTTQALFATYGLPPTEGLAVRRAFTGVATSAVELSGLNPYSRMTDGISRILLDTTRTERGEVGDRGR